MGLFKSGAEKKAERGLVAFLNESKRHTTTDASETLTKDAAIFAAEMLRLFRETRSLTFLSQTARDASQEDTNRLLGLLALTFSLDQLQILRPNLDQLGLLDSFANAQREVVDTIIAFIGQDEDVKRLVSKHDISPESYHFLLYERMIGKREPAEAIALEIYSLDTLQRVMQISGSD